jgi:hypothetical protein
MVAAARKKTIKYRDGYKYQLTKPCIHWISVKPEKDIETPFISLDKTGCLIIQKGYAWDGPSGPTIDTKNFMRGSLVHDALYQLIRQKHLPKSAREAADKELARICLEDGMPRIRVWWVYKSVRKFAGFAATGEKPILEAP